MKEPMECERCGEETEGTKLCLSCSPKGTLFKGDADEREWLQEAEFGPSLEDRGMELGSYGS